MVVAAVIVVVDQLTKWAIVEWIPLYDKVPLNSFLNLTHQQNSGAAFSFLANAGGWQRWFFVILATGVSAVIAVWIWRIRSESQTVLSAGLALVLGGAVGNLIDRILPKYFVTANQDSIFNIGLSHQQTVKRVSVIHWQLIQSQDMA